MLCLKRFTVLMSCAILRTQGKTATYLRNKVLIFLIFLIEFRNINILSLSDFIPKTKHGTLLVLRYRFGIEKNI